MTNTVYKGAYLPVVAGDPGVWGGYLNTNTFPVLDSNLGGIVTKSLTSANVTLTTAEAQNAILYLIGTITANITITTPCQGFTLVNNATTGAFTVTVQYTGGTGAKAVVPQGVLSLIAIDATNGAFILSVATAILTGLIVSGAAEFDGTASFDGTVVFNGTTYTFGAGANSALRAALELSQSVTSGSGTLTINVNSGFNVDLSLTGNVSGFTLTNWPASGFLGKLTLNITNTGAYNITAWPGTTRWQAGLAPTITSGASKRDTIVLTSSDGGTTFRGYVAAINMS